MSPELEAAVERARNYKMTPREKFEQRVLFIYGQMGHKSKLDKSDIRRILIEHEGCDEGWHDEYGRERG